MRELGAHVDQQHSQRSIAFSTNLFSSVGGSKFVLSQQDRIARAEFLSHATAPAQFSRTTPRYPAARVREEGMNPCR